MVDITSHINFARLLLGKSKDKFDLTSYVLGTIAPDAVADPANDSDYRLHHFILGETNPALGFFLETIRAFREKSNISERSFIDGYYAHLWLDNYMRNYGEDIRMIQAPGLTPKQTKTYFKDNIMVYNLIAIKDFVTEIRTPTIKMREIPGLDFISFDTIIKLWNQFVETFKRFHQTEPIVPIITKEQHERFFEQTAKEFIKTYNTVFQPSVEWSVPNYCRM